MTNIFTHMRTAALCANAPLCSGTLQLTSVFIELLNGTHFKRVLHSTAATSKLRFASWCDMPKLDKHMEPYKRCSVMHLTRMHSQIHAKTKSGWPAGWLSNRNIFAIIRHIKSSLRRKHMTTAGGSKTSGGKEKEAVNRASRLGRNELGKQML